MTIDKEIAEQLTSEHPPVNQILLQREISMTKNRVLKLGLKQWIQVLNKKKAFIDLDLYDKIIEISKR